MTHIATVYTYKEGRKCPYIIKYFWSRFDNILFIRNEYVIDGIRIVDEPLKQDLSHAFCNEKDALEKLFGTSVPGIYGLEDGKEVLIRVIVSNRK